MTDYTDVSRLEGDLHDAEREVEALEQRIEQLERWNKAAGATIGRLSERIEQLEATGKALLDHPWSEKAWRDFRAALDRAGGDE